MGFLPGVVVIPVVDSRKLSREFRPTPSSHSRRIGFGDSGAHAAELQQTVPILRRHNFLLVARFLHSSLLAACSFPSACPAKIFIAASALRPSPAGPRL